ncbi:MAG: hypothetical protein IKZ38_01940 [Clostridia bacterium]|nr:hypothetical protein [Clostridia bacterium]
MTKKVSYISLIVLFLITLVMSFSNLNVFGRWVYYGSSPQAIRLEVLTAVIPWEGSDTLPNDTEHGQNHVALIEAILNGKYVSGGEEVQLGLNCGENSYINERIGDRQDITYRDSSYLGSMDLWQANNISNYFEVNEATNKLSFVLDFPKKNEVQDVCYLYTTSVELGGSLSPKVPIGTNIYPIFKTTLIKNANTGVWEAASTEIGYAASKYYSNPLTGLAWEPCFDFANWQAGELGTSTSNAIYSAVGQTLQVHASSEDVPVYYTFKASSATNVKVTVQNSSTATVKVYNSNNKLVSVSAGEQGTQTLTFKTSRNANYYIEVVGALNCSVSISS